MLFELFPQVFYLIIIYCLAPRQQLLIAILRINYGSHVDLIHPLRISDLKLGLELLGLLPVGIVVVVWVVFDVAYLGEVGQE